MTIEGNLRKMHGELDGDNVVQYSLPVKDVLDPMEAVDMNALIGKRIEIKYMGHINSILSGEKMRKVYGEGLTYKEFMESPLGSPSIVRPELSRIHEGIALRDYEWEMKHHMQPHIVYISLTSGFKVGVTRNTNIPYRWIDQGATQAVRLAEVPYRQLAGVIEVSLKSHIADKTHWQKMLKGVVESQEDILDVAQRMRALVPEEYGQYLTKDNRVQHIKYPVLEYPEKVKSLKLDREQHIRRTLLGIKGQYLLFDEGKVLNIRSHSGYRVQISTLEYTPVTKQSSLF